MNSLPLSQEAVSKSLPIVTGRLTAGTSQKTCHSQVQPTVSGAKNLDEILKTFAGISVTDYGGIGGLKTVSVRSLGSQHTAVCYDGIPVSDACNGYVDIGRFNLDNMAFVKVTIGGPDDIFRNARYLTSAGILEIQSVKPDFGQGPVHKQHRQQR